MSGTAGDHDSRIALSDRFVDEDTAVLRQKLKAVDAYVTSFEQPLLHLAGQLTILEADHESQNVTTAIACIRKQIERILSGLSPDSLIRGDLATILALEPNLLHDAQREWQALIGLEGRACEIESERGLAHELVTELIRIARQIIVLFNAALAPANGLRETLALELNLRRQQARRAKELQPPGRPRNAKIQLRDKRLRELRGEHPDCSWSELTKIAKKDAEIKRLSLKVTLDIVRKAIKTHRRTR